MGVMLQVYTFVYLDANCYTYVYLILYNFTDKVRLYYIRQNVGILSHFFLIAPPAQMWEGILLFRNPL